MNFIIASLLVAQLSNLTSLVIRLLFECVCAQIYLRSVRSFGIGSFNCIYIRVMIINNILFAKCHCNCIRPRCLIILYNVYVLQLGTVFQVRRGFLVIIKIRFFILKKTSSAISFIRSAIGPDVIYFHINYTYVSSFTTAK